METNKVRDPIPEYFASYEEAGEFWDNHSTDDYEDIMEDVEVQFDGRRRRFFVEVQDDTFWKARALAKSRQLTVEQLVNQLLESELTKVPAL